jgi:23S rRNA pseudouridine2605 synthase
MPAERVQKILAQVGLASRRKAEELILEGVVTVNGKTAQLGDKAVLGQDAIKVRGKLIHSNAEAPVYLAFYKPRGVISALSDPEGRATLKDFLGKVRGRVYPIGRLDFNSEGLLLLTNDGDFAERLQKNDKVPRVYHVKIRGHADPAGIERLAKGTRVNGRQVKPHGVRLARELESKSAIEIVMIGAGATDLKSLFELKGFLVERIMRMSIGHITLRGLQPGHYRLLQKSQVEALLAQPELGMRLIDQEAEKRPQGPAPSSLGKMVKKRHERRPARPESDATGSHQGTPKSKIIRVATGKRPMGSLFGARGPHAAGQPRSVPSDGRSRPARGPRSAGSPRSAPSEGRSRPAREPRGSHGPRAPRGRR